jgi:hypothetical protein
LALIADNDETFGVGHDLLDIETVAWIVVKRAPDFTVALAQDDLALVSANKDSALGQPAVSCVVLRDVTVLFLRDLPDLDGEHAVLVDVVLVGLVTCDKDDVLVEVAEGDLRADGVSSWVL